MIGKQSERGLSEVLDEILMVVLIVGFAAVILVMVWGVIVPVQKAAYIIPDYSIRNVSGSQSVAIFHRSGDAVSFSNRSAAPYTAAIYIDGPTGSYLVSSDPAIALFRPGDTVYLYFTGSGFALTGNPSALPATTLPFSRFTVRIVDTATQALISRYEFVLGGTTAAPTTVTTTPTPTLTPAQYSITVSWSPSGLGYASLSPPAALTNPQTISVPSGSSLTVFFVPNSNKAVTAITLDGATVYSGSSKGATVSYTVTNILAPRTLAGTFG